MTVFIGGGANESYAGTPGDDVVQGGGGNDTLSGAGGDDFIQGGAGDDLLDGGPGYDNVDYSDATSGVSVNLATGTASGWGNDTLSGFEAVDGSDHDDTIVGDSGDNYVYAHAGNDRVSGGAGSDDLDGEHGNDTLQGGSGDDFLDGGGGDDILDGGTHDNYDYAIFNGAQTGIVFNLPAGTTTDGEGGTDSLVNITGMNGTPYADSILGDGQDNFLYAGDGNDTIDGGAGNDGLPASTGDDLVHGGAGDDWLDGSIGNDTLDGGTGFDTLYYFAEPAGVTVNLATGAAVDGTGGNDVLSGFEEVLGTNYGDSITGDDGNNVLVGHDGNDTFRGNGGDDSIYGDAGDDTVHFSGFIGQYAFEPVGSNGLRVSGPDGVDELWDVEHLAFQDSGIIVDVGAMGTPAADSLAGGGNADLIRAGAGNDHVDGAGGADVLFGEGGADTLDGDDGDDYLDGGSDNDTMRGGTGNDTYVVDSNGDVVQEPDSAGSVPQGALAQTSIGNGIDRVVTSIDYTLGTAIENLQLSVGTGATNGTGNTTANEITGNEIANTLTGLAGNDTIDGGEGIDTSVYAGSNSQYTVSHTEAGWTVSGNGEGSDALTNVERLQFGNGHVALDLEGSAGEVVKVLGAVFGPSFASNAQFVAIGLNFADSGMSYEALMGLALNYVLGANISSSKAVVDLLWANVVGTPIDAATEQQFMGFIDGGGFTAATLGMLAANTSFNLDHIGFAGMQEHGVGYT